ncbi:MAG: proteasome subunit beta, partial [Candidatus Methanofastidiosa archaeon]|nr:proteasome subunit beta [Candidatus Methanofastidiosa archaeon]
ATGNGITLAVIDKDGYRELSDDEIIGLMNQN